MISLVFARASLDLKCESGIMLALLGVAMITALVVFVVVAGLFTWYASTH